MAGRIAGQGSHWIKRAKRLAIYHRDGFACVYCGSGAEVGGLPLTLDHVLACELGGTNEASNLVTACNKCNSTKSMLSLREWFAVLECRDVDTSALARKIQHQTGLVLDMAEGKRLEALRR